MNQRRKPPSGKRYDSAKALAVRGRVPSTLMVCYAIPLHLADASHLENHGPHSVGIANLHFTAKEIVSKFGAHGDQRIDFGRTELVHAIYFVGGKRILDINQSSLLQTLEIGHDHPLGLGTWCFGGEDS
jgi:hypothetical protein